MNTALLASRNHLPPAQVERALGRSTRSEGIVAAYLFLMLVIDGLGAYSLFDIPLPWFAYCVAAAALIHLSRVVRIEFPSGSLFLLTLIAYAGLVQAVSVLRGEPYSLLPARMTTPYNVFIISRFGVLVGALLVSALTYTAARHFGTSGIINATVAAMAFLAAAAIALYGAQVFGYWEPPRNRMGTGGQDYLANTMTFHYQFHRAAGTFREPSHLAEWLAAPFLFIFLCRGRTAAFLWVLVGAALLLTGSLLGVLGVLVGVACFGFFAKKTTIAWRMLLLILILSAAVCGFAEFAAIDFFGAILPRFQALIQGGVGETNRAYVYQYLRAEMPPVFGFGVGNANLVFSEYLGIDLVSSHISLFVNMWFSLGIVGLVLMSLYVACPLLSRRVWKAAAESNLSAILFACILSWLVIYLGHAEELTVMFGVIYGLIWAQADLGNRSPHDTRCRQRPTSSRRPTKRPSAPAGAKGLIVATQQRFFRRRADASNLFAN
jgi:hypothetical protein